jgi:hypothetical protein
MHASARSGIPGESAQHMCVTAWQDRE